MQEGASRMVRTVNHGVAVLATPTRCILSWRNRCTRCSLHACSKRSIRRLTVVRTVVAFLAQEGRARFQQGLDIGSVRRMAVGAVLGHRLVFPQERPALFGVAGVTGLGHRCLLQQLGTGPSMRIVAVGTHDLAGVDRVSRYLEAFSA